MKTYATRRIQVLIAETPDTDMCLRLSQSPSNRTIRITSITNRLQEYSGNKRYHAQSNDSGKNRHEVFFLPCPPTRLSCATTSGPGSDAAL